MLLNLQIIMVERGELTLSSVHGCWLFVNGDGVKRIPAFEVGRLGYDFH